MDDRARLALVIGALLFVPILVILLVSGGNDTRVTRRDRPAPVATASPASPTPTQAPRAGTAAPASPRPVSVEPTELPPLTDSCRSDALLDAEARQRAFRDGLEAERGGTAPSSASVAWLDTLRGDLDRCAGSLTADLASLRNAMDTAVAAADAYAEAIAAPRDNSVNRAWSDLSGALDDVIERWSATS